MSENVLPENEKKLLSTLGLCVKAGKVIFGVPMICDAMRKGGEKSPVTVLSAADISENTQKRITDKCAFYKVRHIQIGSDCETLGRALGKSAVAAVMINDQNFCRALEKKLGI